VDSGRQAEGGEIRNAPCDGAAPLRTRDFDYALPPELIAQEPLPDRCRSRMMVLDRTRSSFGHRKVTDLPDFLRPGDVLVLNDTRVIPARVFGAREDTGGQVEFLLLEPVGRVPDGEQWLALYRASARAKPGLAFRLAHGRLHAEIAATRPGGRVVVTLQGDAPVLEILEREGVPPVPPYIRRARDGDPRVPLDRERYQTVYARVPGAVAAPTAGLHLTEGLLEECRARGVETACVTLHVGPGTFLPVKEERIENHRMEEERYEVGAGAASTIERARSKGGRIVAVGSTVVRTLETIAASKDKVVAGSGRSGLFIRPPFTFRAVDALLTNFHLPRSTLLMMVSAFAGPGRVRAAYREAMVERYRFYSYGDCMLIL